MNRSYAVVSSMLLASAAYVALAPGCTSQPSQPAGPSLAPIPYVPIVPPARTGAVGSGSDQWFAVQTFFFGINPGPGSLTKPSKAWQDFGFDLDGRSTTPEQSAAAGTPAGATAADTCMRLTGSSSNYLVDGPGGIDNNFGQFVVQTIKSLKSDWEDAVNADVASGGSTLILHLTNFSTQDHDGVPGELYLANHLDGGGAPKFDTTDKWTINSTSLNGGASLRDGDPFPGPGSATHQFPAGYLAKGQWVSGSLDAKPFALDLPLPFGGMTVVLPISAVVVSMNVDGSNGTIAGALNVESFKMVLGPVLARVGRICPDNPNYPTYMDSLTRSADVVFDKPQRQDPGQPCTGISLGIGFVAKPTGVPDKVYVSPAPSDPGPCDAGIGDGGGGRDGG